LQQFGISNAYTVTQDSNNQV